MNKRELLAGLIDLINDNIYSKHDIKGVIDMTFLQEIVMARKDFAEATNNLVWNYDIDIPIVKDTLAELDKDQEVLKLAEKHALDDAKRQMLADIFESNKRKGMR